MDKRVYDKCVFMVNSKRKIERMRYSAPKFESHCLSYMTSCDLKVSVQGFLALLVTRVITSVGLS